MRTRVGQSPRESTSWSARVSAEHGRAPVAGRPRPGAPRSPLPSGESTPFRLPPVFPPQRTFVEEIGEALGEDFSTVRIEPRSQDAVALGAFAFARGEQIGFAPGQYRPDTSAGLRLIAHELAHVAQQRRSPVPVTGTIAGQTVNEDPRLELEAERLGARAAAGAAGAPAPLHPAGPPTHRMTSSPAQLGRARISPEQRQEAARRRQRQQEREQERELLRLRGSSTGQLKHKWEAIRYRTQRTLAKIREFDQISQANPRPRRLQGRDRSIAQRLDQLDRQAQILFENFEILDRGSDDLKNDKAILAEIIVEGKALETELGKVGSDIEAKLGPLDDFAGDVNNHLYHTGTYNDPIPIFWYKNPATDYRNIVIPNGNPAGVTPGNYAYPNGPTTAENFPFDLTVDATNQPVVNNLAAFELQKQPLGSRPDKTPNQVAANAALRNAGYNLRAQNPAMDGDHVRDLGFGGDDDYDNYWPLAEGINRRAFLGYNSGYLINYINHHKDADQNNPNGNPDGRPTTQPIGGMAGRYFIIKDFMANNAGNIPDESGEETAGTA